MEDSVPNDSKHSLLPSSLNFFLNRILIKVVPKYLNSSALSKELLPIFIFWLCPVFSSRDMTMYSGTPCIQIILDMQKIQIIGLFFENRLHWQFGVWLLLYTVCTCVSTFLPHQIWSYRSHNTVLYLIW